MSDREYWTKAPRKAERELDAATRLSDVNAAAKRLMLAKTELRRLRLWLAEGQDRHEWALDRRLELRGNQEG